MAIEAWSEKFSPLSFIAAAESISWRAASMFTAISAKINRRPWNFAIDCPNCFRFLAYFTASSRAAWATPTDWAAIPIRPLSRPVMAILNPSPSLPSKLSFGIRQFSNIRSTVSDARRPILSSIWPTLIPVVPWGTRNALIPLCPLLLSV